MIPDEQYRGPRTKCTKNNIATDSRTKVRRFWLKEPDHSETFLGKKRCLYRSTGPGRKVYEKKNEPSPSDKPYSLLGNPSDEECTFRKTIMLYAHSIEHFAGKIENRIDWMGLVAFDQNCQLFHRHALSWRVVGRQMKLIL